MFEREFHSRTATEEKMVNMLRELHLLIEAQYDVVLSCNRITLLPIIQREVDSEIHSDEWGAYRTLDQHRYVHNTNNHLEFFIHSATGANT